MPFIMHRCEKVEPCWAWSGDGARLTAPSPGIDSDHGQPRKGERRELAGRLPRYAMHIAEAPAIDMPFLLRSVVYSLSYEVETGMSGCQA
jgi:hypothetical protein